MMRLENVSGHEIVQRFLGKEYVWEEPGDVMTLDDRVGGWMVAKLNNVDSNPALKDERKKLGKPDHVYLKILSSKPGDQRAESNVVRAAKAPKAPAQPAPAKPPAQ